MDFKMNFMEICSKFYSRKAAVVIVSIAALTYIAVLQAEADKQIDQQLARLAIYGIAWLGTLGIVAQGVIDWRNPNQTAEEPVKPEETINQGIKSLDAPGE